MRSFLAYPDPVEKRGGQTMIQSAAISATAPDP